MSSVIVRPSVRVMGLATKTLPETTITAARDGRAATLFERCAPRPSLSSYTTPRDTTVREVPKR